MAEHRTLNPQVEGSIPSAPIRAISHEVALFFCPPPAAQALALFRLRSIRARFALFRCAPYGLYAGYVLGLAPLRAYAVGYGHSALFRLRSIRAPYASAIVRALKRRARNALGFTHPFLFSIRSAPQILDRLFRTVQPPFTVIKNAPTH